MEKNDANDMSTYFANTINGQNTPSTYFTWVSIGDVKRQLCVQIGWNASQQLWVRSYWNGWSNWTQLIN